MFRTLRQFLLVGAFSLMASMVWANATISVGDGSGEPGDTVTININISSSPQNVTGVNFTLTYDTNALNFQSAAAGAVATSAGKMLSANEPSDGTVKIVIFGLNTNAIADGVIATVTFSVNDDATNGDKAITISGISCTDADADSVSATGSNGTITISGASSNHAPVISSGPTPADSSIDSEGSTTVSVTATDADNDPLTYTWTATTGTITGSGASVTYTAPEVSSDTTATITVTVSDGNGGTDSDTCQITIEAPAANHAPVISSGPTPADSSIDSEGSTTVSVTATDADNDPLTYTWTATTGTITGSGASVTYTAPEVSSDTTATITVTVSDGNGGTDSDTCQITIEAPEQASSAVLSVGNVSANAGSEVQIPVSIDSTPDGVVTGVNFRLVYNSSVMSYESVAIGSAAQAASKSVSAQDHNGYVSAVVFGLNTTGIQDGQVAIFTFSIDSDADTQNVTISLSQVACTDADASSVSATTSSGTLSITAVEQENHAPVISSGPTPADSSIDETETTTVSVTATDADSDTLTYTWTATNGTISGTGASVTFTPANIEEDTTATITVVVSDGNGGSDTGSCTISITAVDQTPPARITDLAVDSRGPTSITLSWTAPGDDGNMGQADSYTVKYSTSPITLATWASATTVSQNITPKEAGGDETITITGLQKNRRYFFAVRAEDEEGNISGLSNIVAAFTLRSARPTVSAAANPSSGEAELTVSFTVTASDDGSIVGYAWDFDGQGSIDWASHTTGNCSYTYTEPGTYYPTVIVRDNDGLRSSYMLTLTVSKPSSEDVPTIELSSNTTTGTAPLGVVFSLDIEDDYEDDAISIEWDFDGDRIVDATTDGTARQMKYIYLTPGVYRPQVKVFFDEVSVSAGIEGNTITVSTPSGSLPGFSLSEPVISYETSAGLATATFSISTETPSSFRVFKWDFDSDGVIDYVTRNASASVTHTYYNPDEYTVSVVGVTRNGYAIKRTTSVNIYQETTETYPTADFNMSANGSAVTQVEGVPATVLFQDNSTSSSNILSYQWDFNGDGIVDELFIRGTDAYTDFVTNGISHTFDAPGNYLVAMDIFNADGEHDSIAKQLLIKPSTSSVLVPFIIAPKTGLTFSGDVFTILFAVPKMAALANATNASLEYKLSSAEDYAEAEGLTVSLANHYVQWDVSEIKDGTYDVRVVLTINGTDYTSNAIEITLQKNADSPDIQESRTNNRLYKKELIRKRQLNKVRLQDRTEVEIPSGLISNDEDYLELRQLTGDDVSRPLDIRSASRRIRPIGVYRRIKLSSADHAEFTKQIKIVIPYPDDNGDGYVDGTTVPETNLVPCYYDDTAGEWKDINSFFINMTDNLVVLYTNHLTDFGLGEGEAVSETGGGTGTSSSGGGCFIVTASCGSDSHEVAVLRQYRDKVLLKNPIGRGLVRFYYKVSPPIADFIEKREGLRKLVRASLQPIVSFAEGVVSEK